jgi:DNA-binding CsgD family transcriptional regulator
VFVNGPAGIGKTTLVRAALKDRPHVVGSSLDSLRWKPYLPLSLAIGDELRGDPETVASEVVRALDGRALFVDDLHWADLGTRRVLGLLAGHVALVVTSRPDELPPWESLTVIDVEPLDDTSSRALARRLHPDLVSDEVDRLVASAGGVPLLLEQMTADGRATLTLRAAAAARLERMPPHVGDLVVELALLGRPVPLDLFEVQPAELPVGLVVQADERVNLVHSLLAEVALDSLDTSSRAAAHRRLARRLPDGEAAEHFLAAGDRAAATAAAERYLAVESDPVGRAHVLSIAAEAGGDPDRALAAAAALVEIGDWAGAIRIADAVDSGDPEVQAMRWYHTARSRWFSGDVAGARLAAEAGLAEVAGSGVPIEARLLVERAHQRVRTEHGSRATTQIAEEALRVAEGVGVDVPRARLVYATALAHDDLPGWEEGFLQVIDEAAASGDGESESAAAFFLASHYGFRDRAREAIELLDRAIARADELGQITWQTHMRGAQLTDRFFAGDEPHQLADDCRRFIDTYPMFRNRAQTEMAMALCLADDDRGGEAHERLAAARQLLTSTDDQTILLAAAAELAYIAGERAVCVELAEEAVRLGPGWFGITAGTVAAAAHARLEAGAPVPVCVPSVMMPVFGLFVREVEALSEAGDDHLAALDALDALTGEWRRLGARRYDLRTRYAAGLIAARAEHPSARRRLCAVRDEAEARGPAWIGRRAVKALTTLDRAPALTKREETIVRLAGEGLTSAAIAERLGISRVTVETHVRSAMRKLGATTRRQAVAMLSQRESS